MMKTRHKLLLPASTIVLMLLAVLGFQYAPDGDTLSAWGSYIGGVAAAIAFLWLIAGYLQQVKELSLQREELALQRRSLEMQCEELKRMSRHSALDRVSAILDGFKDSMPRDSSPHITKPNQLSTAFLEGSTRYWKTITESHDPKTVLDAWGKWHPIECVCKEFLSIFASAVNLYAEATRELVPIESNSTLSIVTQKEVIRRIPHLQQYSNEAVAVAELMHMMEPGIKRVRLAGCMAIEAMFPGSTVEEELNKLKQEVAQRDAKLNEEKQRQRGL